LGGLDNERTQNKARVVVIIVILLVVVWWGYSCYVDYREEQRAKEYSESLTRLCMKPGEAPQQEAPELPDAKFLVLTRWGRTLHEWHDELPDEWRAENSDEVDFDLCRAGYAKGSGVQIC
jgi:hypothetical protein